VQQQTRKPFVAPRIKEEASLVDVTLISGGGHVRRPKFKDCKKNTFSHGRRS
jgi:hypothetical protein